ncbi:MAG: ComEC/Rec2 family competence protein [Myxococcota bacterium]
MAYSHIISITAVIAILASACSSEPSDGNDPTDPTNSDAVVSDASDSNAQESNDTLQSGAEDARDTSDTRRTNCASVPDPPSDPIEPTPGELFYMQLGLGGFSIGESALIVGPEGTVVAFDVGNDSHDDDVVDALGSLNEQMVRAGFPQRDADTIDHIVVTHYHADHGDGITDLLENVALAGRIVSRGMYDLTEAANLNTATKVCDAAAANAGSSIELCTGNEAAPCDDGSRSGIYPASGCPGLKRGNLLGSTDNSRSSYLPLGSSRLVFLGANGFMNGESFAEEIGPLDADDGNGENARSIVALLAHGPFRMLLTGDLTGGGDDTDDVESFYASRLSTVSDIDERGIDVLHAGHHGRKTSTNATWLERLFSSTERARNVVMGISTAHLNSPHGEVLERIETQGLNGGSIWTTKIATAGDSADALVNADGGRVLLSTVNGGDGYVIQAISDEGMVIESRAFAAARCP